MERTSSNVIEQAPAEDRKSRKRRKKVRSVWISFVGRILAQFVGSAATIVLGLLLLHKYQPAKSSAAAANTVEKTDVVATTLHRHDPERSVALLPLRDVSKGREEADVAHSMTDVVAAALADVPDLHVVARTTPDSHAAPRAASDVPTSFGARYVLEGSVAEADGLFRVIVRLIDAEHDEQVWASRYDRPARNMFKMQDEIAAALVRDVKSAIVDREDGVLPTTWRF